MIIQKKMIDSDPKAIQQIEFVGQLKDFDIINAAGGQSVFYLNTFRKNQRNKNFLQEM